MVCRMMPVATETLSESTLPPPSPPSCRSPPIPMPGPPSMRTMRLHARRTLVRSPLPSLPITSTDGLVIFSDVTSSARSSAAAPNTSHPSSVQRAKKRCMTPTLCTVTASMAPLLALLTTGESGALFLAHTTTPATPRKCADRIMAPRFCGSTTSSNASHRGGAPRVSQGGSESKATGSRGDASITTPLCGRGGEPVSMLRSCLLTVSTATSRFLAAVSSDESKLASEPS
mmetsp:Transcript_31378/g.50405  ORF Transcript_31378/g.50405 Transcript_31378/m.50405 type:complete len:230 (-) Transcript_31378:193-882(-)